MGEYRQARAFETEEHSRDRAVRLFLQTSADYLGVTEWSDSIGAGGEDPLMAIPRYCAAPLPVHCAVPPLELEN